MTSAIQASSLPPSALLRRYADGGGYADCYCTVVDGAVTQAAFVEAFYTTPLFKLERLLLRWFARRPSTDADAAGLAHGRRSSFAAWTVEDRGAGQLLLGDFSGNTKSWLMTAGEGGHTRLYFGSAVVPRTDRVTGQRRMGWPFRALLGFHKLYSRALLASARSRVMARR